MWRLRAPIGRCFAIERTSPYSTLSRCLRLTPSGRWTTYWQRRISATYRTVFTRRFTRIPSGIFRSGSTPKACELEGSSSTITEKDNDQKACGQDRPHHRRHRRDWVGYWKTFRQRGCLCLHHRPPPEGTRRGREGNRHQRFWSSGRRCPIG